LKALVLQLSARYRERTNDRGVLFSWQSCQLELGKT
jgi:hypothetical protein